MNVWSCSNLSVVLSIKLINSTYHLSNLSTQHPQYQNQPLNSPPIFTIDQFPLTRKIKNPGSETCPLTSPDSRKSLVFYIFSIFYSLTFDINTTVSTCTVIPNWSTPLTLFTSYPPSHRIFKSRARVAESQLTYTIRSGRSFSIAARHA